MGAPSIPRVVPGQRSIPARAMNDIIEAVEGVRALGLQGPDGQLLGYGLEAVLLADTGAQGDDYLAVELADSGEYFEFIKPPLLRPSLIARGGLTYSYTTVQKRVASNGSTTETQVIVEPYLVGDIIIGQPFMTAAGAVLWVDQSPRAWAKESA